MKMEVVAATPSSGGVPPFHNHDVREWSRIDSLTGVLERARLETDHWSANTSNSSHKYGKVVDSRARSGADGVVQQQAKRQLEVFQSSVPGGRLQVIKTHTVSSSRWTNKTSSTDAKGVAKDFEDLQLSLNPLDLSSQKSKASVGRSVSRRPPTRPRTRDDHIPDGHDRTAPRDAHQTAATNLHRVSRLCHQIHEDAVRHTFGKYYQKPPIHERQSGDGSVEICEIESESNGHAELKRTKSSSSEDLNLESDKATKSIEDLEDLEQLRNWRRSSKVRRSLQFSKQGKPSEEDPETGRRLSTALRGNNIDLDALDQILQSISSSSSSHSEEPPKEEPEKDEESPKKQKRNSFVTVESLREVKERLRHTSQKEEEIDDGIVTEEAKEMPAGSRVRSYVYGMEAMLNKKPVLGTGSLESKSKQLNYNSTSRGDDWHNRRKSYGFEQVTGEQTTIQNSKSKTRMESSTDSGICRSTEIVVPKEDSAPESDSLVKKYSMLFEKNENPFNSRKAREELSNIWNRRSSIETNGQRKQPVRDSQPTTITIPITTNPTWNKDDTENDIKRHSIAVDESKYVTRNTDNKYRRTSLAANDTDNYFNDGADAKKQKKVEFCKTEVHFTAESGKVNIVETDEKPPPTNNFRRRRKNVGPISPVPDDFNRNGLPVLHFGDSSYEKVLLGLKDLEFCDKLENCVPAHEPTHSIVTVNSNTSTITTDDERREAPCDSEFPKGILKNKPVKPKPYILGSNEEALRDDNEIIENTAWGVRLKHVPREESAPIWRSTVTVRNTFYDKQNGTTADPDGANQQPEFQRLLRTLRPTQKEEMKLPAKRPETDNFGGIRIISPSVDPRRSSWSVADKVKRVEDIQWTENKGYSTKVNFGEGEATIVENGNRQAGDNVRQIPWAKTDEENKDLPPTPAEEKIENRSDSNCTKGTGMFEKSIQHTQMAKKSTIMRNKYSPILIRKTAPKQAELGTPYPTEKLSSPSLVGQNIVNGDIKLSSETSASEVVNSHYENIEISDKRSQSPKLRHRSPSKDANNMVLRQPRKSEMAYFGLPVSPKSTKKEPVAKPHTKLSSEKPDLLQHHQPRRSKTTTAKKKEEPKTDNTKRAESPVYANVQELNVPTRREFDASILEELTKAADQILQAVNGYTDDDSINKNSTDDDSKCRSRRNEPLDTISETKSWKQHKIVQTKTSNARAAHSKSKLKHTSSTSSVESVTRDCRKPIVSSRRNSSVAEEKQKKNTLSSTKATTKARRLQRASSREALLQSYGSSSEDLPTNVVAPLRKPRVIKKTKTAQLSITNGLEMTKKASSTTTSSRRREVSSSKPEERLPTLGLPEIRHKTAVSTIRSTAEKSALREKMKSKTEEAKKRSAHRKESNRGSLSAPRQEKSKQVTLRDGTSHRYSTANIKKCSKLMD